MTLSMADLVHPEEMREGLASGQVGKLASGQVGKLVPSGG
jgi:hypothetical protein